MEKGTEGTRRTRRTLLMKVKDSGNEHAWQEFYDMYRHLIYGAAMKAGLNHQESQDVVAETMAGVLRRIGLFEYDPAKGRFSGWLMRQAKWRIQDQFRKRGPQSPGQRDTAVGATRTSTIARLPDPNGDSFESMWNQELNRRLLEVA